MNNYQRIAFFIIFVIYGQVHVVDAGTRAKPVANIGKKITCPSNDFSTFIKAFSESVEVQMEFTKYPLQEQRLDLNAEPEPMPVIRKIQRAQAVFPLIPNEVERKARLLALNVEQLTASHIKVDLAKANAAYQSNYEFGFQQDDCWHLLAVSNQSLWLESLFPMMDNCTPRSFYYDKNVNRSNYSSLEKNGYHPYKIDEYTAKYKVDEKFFGFDATEIAIPSDADSIYTVTVNGNAKDLAEVIKIHTGYTPSIYNNKFKSKSAKPYLVQEAGNKTTFVCFTFEGGF